MRILIIDTYYPKFLSDFYHHYPTLASQPYTVQHQSLMGACFGTSDYYSKHLNELGHEATEVVPNCEPLQRRWARENDIAITDSDHWDLTWRRGVIPWVSRRHESNFFEKVLEAQIRDYRPDVLYVHDINAMSDEFIHRMRDHVRFIAGQTAFFLVDGRTYSGFDLMLTSFPHYVDRFRANGIASEYFRLGFEPAVLDRLPPVTSHYDVTFAGGLTRAHKERTKLLEAVASRCAIDVWGYGVATLDRNSPLRARHHGPAWALDMYQVLHQSRITLNQHVEASEGYANNMRLYEATGVGALLITDAKNNLNDMFSVGNEVIAYHSIDECVEAVEYYLQHENERAEIAHRGQARTLKEHTYRHRMEELSEILQRYVSIGRVSS
ncbi:MAG: glycosyltransferase [Capsulimonas sp.]|uniref:CgeB family protein n=1 Tax=Capsulimonas sp. TaxID=2494211 RepID=UPI0032642232